MYKLSHLYVSQGLAIIVPPSDWFELDGLLNHEIERDSHWSIQLVLTSKNFQNMASTQKHRKIVCKALFFSIDPGGPEQF